MFSRSFRQLCCLVFVCFVVTTTAQAGTGVLSGIVEDSAGAPIAGARVELLDADADSLTGEDGRFRFEGLSPGNHLVLAEAEGFAGVLESIRVPDGGEARLELHLGVVRQVEEEVIVTGTPFGRGADEVYQAASVLQGVDLAAALQPTLGETLANEPGVSSTWFGPVASRPIIRGQGGDRIRVMQDGIESGDASSASPDHAVAVDPFSSERIEIVRGPATLLYGSSAVGGVVNVFDNRIPKRAMSSPVAGRVQVHGATADDQLSGAFSVDAGTQRVAFHADGVARDTEDLDTPAGRLENSWSESAGGALGVSAVGDWGHAGVSYGAWDTTYGSPAEEEISIDLEQERFDLSAERRFGGPVRALRVRGGLRDYEHVELEGEEIGTRFLSDYWEGRADLVFATGKWEGTAGLQYSDRDFEAIGDEAFVPFTNTETLGVFGFAEWASEPWAVQVGGRFETRDVTPRGAEGRDFDGVSLSAGLRRSWAGGLSLTGAVTRSVKLPSAEELFSDGPHLATNQFEIGDPDLDEEEAITSELAFRKTGERVNAELALFHTSFNDYIFQTGTGAVKDDLPVFEFRQSDASFVGGEFSLDVGLLEVDPHALRFEFALQHVEAERSGGVALPRIPPLEARVGLRGERGPFWGAFTATWVDSQTRVEPGETTTPDHFLLDLSFGYRWFIGNTVHDLVLQGRNLTDELARNHASFLKDIAPMPGANVSLTYRLTF
jgi:iron complex outermembrane receptor protein